MVGHRLGDVLATSEPCGHQGEGVSPVEGSARWTQGLSSSATGLEQNSVGQCAGIERNAGVASVLTDADRPSGKADWTSAASDPSDLGVEGIDASGSVQPGQDPFDDPPIGLRRDVGDQRSGGGGRDVCSHDGKGAFPPVD